jgi:hypothetical protein
MFLIVMMIVMARRIGGQVPHRLRFSCVVDAGDLNER